MATVPYGTPTRPNIGTGVVYQWTLAQGDDGVPSEEFTHADRSVQVTGTFGGATVSLEGSNDGTNYVVLTDNLGNALTFSAAGLKAITECTRYIRPKVTGGDVTTALVVSVFGRKNP